MQARTKFLFGAVLMVGTVGYLMATGIKETGVYFLTPSELASRVTADPSFREVGVKVGAKVTPTTVVGLIEAMKLFNEVAAECNGTLVEILVDNQQPVEFGQVLMRVDPAT